MATKKGTKKLGKAKKLSTVKPLRAPQKVH